MEASIKLTLVLNELIDLRRYINVLNKDGSLNQYTTSSILSKLDRCEDIHQGKVISKNR